MKQGLALMCILFLISAKSPAQNLETLLSLDTRTGYATNAVLLPFLGEWDRTAPSGYGLIAPSGILLYDRGRFSGNLTLGGLFEGFTGSDHESATGGYAGLNLTRQLGHRWFAGLESGASLMTGRYERDLYWVQPTVSWQPTLFTRLSLKMGSSFRHYRQLPDDAPQEREASTRFDLYSLELQNWISFRWLLRAGLHGDLNDPAGSVSLRGSLEHLLTERLSMGLRAGMDQYSYRMTLEGSGGGGFPGGGPPGSGPGPTTTLEETDRIWRMGLTASYRLNRNIELFASGDQLLLRASATDETIHDLHTSLGLRFSIRPGRRAGMRAEADWQQNDRQVVSLRIRYSGEGRLYLTGDFNNWQNPGIPLVRQSAGRYVAELSLDPGAWEYKILLVEGGDEQWIEFSEDTYTVPDGFGGENGLIFIE